MKPLSLMEVSKLLGVGYWRVRYAETTGKIPAPERIGVMKVYTPEQVEKIRDYFDRPAFVN